MYLCAGPPDSVGRGSFATGQKSGPTLHAGPGGPDPPEGAGPLAAVATYLSSHNAVRYLGVSISYYCSVPCVNMKLSRIQITIASNKQTQSQQETLGDFS